MYLVLFLLFLSISSIFTLLFWLKILCKKYIFFCFKLNLLFFLLYSFCKILDFIINLFLGFFLFGIPVVLLLSFLKIDFNLIFSIYLFSIFIFCSSGFTLIGLFLFFDLYITSSTFKGVNKEIFPFISDLL